MGRPAARLAREGRPLAHDTMDADFAVLREDAPLVEETAPALARAGFRRHSRYRNNAGQTTQYTFLRHGAKFEFFVLFPAPRDGFRRYYEYTPASPEPAELEGELPVQALEPFEFLGRHWLKPTLHERELTTLYGEWRTPDPRWSHVEDRCIIARRAWSAPDHYWD